MIKCDNCGEKKFTLVKEELHMQVFECDSCGNIFNSLVYPDADLYDEADVTIDIVWYNNEPTAKDVLSIRKLFPSVLKTGVSEFLSEIKAERKWHAGVYSEFHANELKEKAKNMNLNLIVKKTAI
jgi:hypothetical protein